MCDHKLIPIVYGYMGHEMMIMVSSGDVIYGNSHKYSGDPEWFCLLCLEEIYI